MLSTKISTWVGASLLAHCGITASLDGADPTGVARDLVVAGPLSARPVPVGLAGEMLTRIADRDLVEIVIDKSGRRHRRDRALPAWVVVYVVFGLCLFAGEGYASVLRQVWPGLSRLRTRQIQIPDASALVKARQRVGAEPLAMLFDQVRGPVAAPDTPGAFRFGLRLVAVDGTVLDVPDSTDNDAAFDRSCASSKAAASTPQVRLTLLTECATHAILAARFDGTQTSEQAMTDAMLTDLQPGMLLLADRLFFSMARWLAAAGTGAQLLWRMKLSRAGDGGAVSLPVLQLLPDGSYLSRLHEGSLSRANRGKQVGHTVPRLPDTTVRVIDFVITVTTADGGTRHEPYRLLTTLLDHTTAPASELADCYHERWEAETGYGHLKTRLRGPRAVLRSRHPDTVSQEIWAYLCVYQALCRLAAAAAEHGGLDPDRISFTITVRAFRRTLTNPTDHPPHQLIAEILAQRLPERRDRTSTRGKKPANRQPRTQRITYKITIHLHSSA